MKKVIGKMEFTLFLDNLSLTKVDEPMRNVAVPSFVDFGGKNYYVNEIGAVFRKRGEMEQEADWYSVSFGDDSKVAKIGQKAFSSLKLINFRFPKTLEVIDKFAFAKCIFDGDVVFNEGLRVLDVGSFAYSNVRTIKLPESLEKISVNAFFGCMELVNIDFAENIKIEKLLHQTFYRTNIRKIVIPKSVKIIEAYTFEECNLETVQFVDDSMITIIEPKAFNDGLKNLINLPALVIKDNIKGIPKYTFSFYNCLNVVTFNSNFSGEIFDDYSFARTNICQILIPKTVKALKSNVFKNSKLETVFFEKESVLEKIGDYCFFGTNIRSITIPSSVSKINKFAFSQIKTLEKFELENPSNISFINPFCFSESSIKSITLSETMEKIEIFPFSFSDYKPYDNSIVHDISLNPQDITHT